MIDKQMWFVRRETGIFVEYDGIRNIGVRLCGRGDLAGADWRECPALPTYHNDYDRIVNITRDDLPEPFNNVLSRARRLVSDSVTDEQITAAIVELILCDDESIE